MWISKTTQFLRRASLVAGLALGASSAFAAQMPVLWGVDEDDGELFSIGDYTQISNGASAAGFTSWGSLKWNDNGTIKTVGSDLEAFTLDDNGNAYLALDRNLGSTPDSVLLTFNINDAPNLASTPLEVIGNIASNNSGVVGDNVSGMSIDPLTGDLWVVFRNGGRDELGKISKTDASLLTGEFNIEGQGHQGTNVEDIEFDADGNLYAVDVDDDHLYRIDLTGVILEMVDKNLFGDKIEGLAWDHVNNKLVGSDDASNQFGILTLGNGVKTTLGGFASLTDVEGMDFVPASAVAASAPGTLGLIALGMIGLLRRRR